MKLFDLTPAIPSSLLPYWQLLGTRENDVEATEELYLLHQFKGDGFTARHYQQRTGLINSFYFLERFYNQSLPPISPSNTFLLSE